MPSQLNEKKKWTEKSNNKFKRFILLQKKYLSEHFYDNLANPENPKKKINGFYKKMGNFVGKSLENCTSKFQKNQSKIYCDYLNIPLEHYKLFEYYKLRRINIKKDSIITRTNKRIKKDIKDKNFYRNESQRLEVLKEIENNKQIEEIFNQLFLNNLPKSKSNNLNIKVNTFVQVERNFKNSFSIQPEVFIYSF